MSPRVRWAGCVAAVVLYASALVLPFSLHRGRPWLGGAPGWKHLRGGFQEFVSLDRWQPYWDFTDGVFRLSWLGHLAIWLMVLAFVTNRSRLILTFSLIGTCLTLFGLAAFAPWLIHRPGYWAWCLSAMTGMMCWQMNRRHLPAELTADYGPLEARIPDRPS